jgi:sugar phosphate isomerase/epimerase
MPLAQYPHQDLRLMESHMSFLAVSSFSLHSVLGPLRLDRRQPDGSLTAIEYDFPRRHSLEEFADLVRQRLGVSAIELCQIQFDGDTPERIERLKEGLDKSGVRLLAVPIDIGDLASVNPEWRAEDMARIVRWFDIAKTLGASYVRVNAGEVGSSHAVDSRASLVSALQALGDAAGERGLRLLIENHGGTSSDPDFMLGLCADVGSARLGILLDLGNFDPLVSLSRARFTNPDVDDSGLDVEPIYAHIRKLAPVADLIHAKSIDPASDGRPLPDLPRALDIVKAAGYRGHISIEWEGRKGDPWERTANVVAQVRAAFPELA